MSTESIFGDDVRIVCSETGCENDSLEWSCFCAECEEQNERKETV